MKTKHFFLALGLVLASPACDSDDTDGETGASTSSTGDTGGSTAADGSTSGGGSEESTGGAPLVCEGDERMTCTVEVDCEMYQCGSEISPFDADGCLKGQFCQLDSDCDDGQTCMIPEGNCIDVVSSCMDVDGVCECNFPGPCGGVCG